MADHQVGQQFIERPFNINSAMDMELCIEMLSRS